MGKNIIRQFYKILCLTLSVMLGLSNPVYSLPKVSQVVNGSADIQQNGNTLTINATDKAVVNYSSFDIAAGESVIVKLPSDSSSILNRVIGSGASQILGNLTSNGLFILVNPNGVYIGSQATINATNLIISTRDINNQDFFSGNYFFKKLTPSQVDALLENSGTINIKEGGFGVLIAGGINNKGTIIASLGKVALASGDAVQLNMGGNGLISVAIDQKVASQIKDINGNPITNQINNSGNIQAEVVMLNAKSLPHIFSNAINTQGIITANSAVNGQNGQVIFEANNPVVVSGTVSATGGNVNVTAMGESTLGNINANSLSLNASSEGPVHYVLNSGSSVNLTGDFSIGQGSTINASNAYIGVGGNWLNSGLFNGDTSTVEFISPNTAQILGNNIFYNFESMVPNKVLQFQAGDLQTILGLWKIQGAYGQHERLVSTQPGVQWLSNSVGTRDLTYAWVADGNNINANKIVMTQSTNRGNSPGWDPTGTWHYGGVNNNWSTPGNWTGLGGATPGAGDTAVFNGTSTANSTVDSSFGGSIGEIDMNSGYTGTLSLGRSLTVTNASGNTGKFTLASGTFSQGANSLTVIGDYGQTGGTFNGGSAAISLGTLTQSAGTFTSTSGTMTVTGNLNLSGTGTFNHNNGTVVVNLTDPGGGGQILVLTGNGQTFNNLTLEGTDNSGATDSIGIVGNLTVANNLLMQNNSTSAIGGALNIITNNPGDTPVITVQGNTTISTAGGTQASTFGDGSLLFNLSGPTSSFTLNDHNDNFAGWVEFSGTGNQTLTQTAGTMSSNIKVYKSSGVASLATDYINTNTSSSNSLLINSGIFDLAGHNLVYSLAPSFSNSDTLRLRGSETITNVSNDTSHGTVQYNGTGTYNSLAFGNSYNDLTMSGTGTFNLNNNLTVNDKLTNTSGTLNTNGKNVTVTGPIVINGGTFTGSTGSVTAGSLTLSSGNLTAPSTTMTVNGNVDLSGTGTFNHNNGTFVVDATSDTTFGPWNNTFNNLTLMRDGNSATNTSITVFDNAIVNGNLLVQNNNAGSGGFGILSNGTARTWTLKGNMTVSSSAGSALLTVGDGLFTFDFNNSTAASSFTSSYANATTAGTLQFDSAQANTLNQVAGAITGNLTVNGKLKLSSNYNGTGASQNLTIGIVGHNGVFNLNGHNLTYSNPVTFLNLGTVQAIGTETVTNLANDSASGGTIQYTGTGTYSSALPFGNNYFTVDFSGSGSTWNLSAPLTSAYLSIDLSNITVNANGQPTTTTGSLNTLGTFLASTGTQNITNLVVNSGGTFTGGSGTVNIKSGGVTINQYGILTAPTGEFSVTGGWSNSGTFIPGTGTVIFTGTGTDTLNSGSSSFYNVNVNYQSGGKLQLQNNPLAVNDLTISSGTLDANNQNITVSGNWNNSGGTFIPRTGTVTLNGVNQTISGPTTFYNLTKRNTNNNGTSQTLTFAAGSTQTVNGTLTLTGNDSNDQLVLVSSSPGSQWGVNASTSSVANVNVTDSNASGGNNIAPTGSVNGGDNINWSFPFVNTQPVDQTHNSSQADANANGSSSSPTIAPSNGGGISSLFIPQAQAATDSDTGSKQKTQDADHTLDTGGTDSSSSKEGTDSSSGTSGTDSSSGKGGTDSSSSTGGTASSSGKGGTDSSSGTSGTASSSSTGGTASSGSSSSSNVSNASKLTDTSVKTQVSQTEITRATNSYFLKAQDPWKEFGQKNIHTEQLESQYHVIETSRPDGVYVIPKAGVGQGKEINLGAGESAVTDLIAGIRSVNRIVNVGRVQ